MMMEWQRLRRTWQTNTNKSPSGETLCVESSLTTHWSRRSLGHCLLRRHGMGKRGKGLSSSGSSNSFHRALPIILTDPVYRNGVERNRRWNPTPKLIALKVISSPHIWFNKSRFAVEPLLQSIYLFSAVEKYFRNNETAQNCKWGAKKTYKLIRGSSLAEVNCKSGCKKKRLKRWKKGNCCSATLGRSISPKWIPSASAGFN